MKPEHLAVLESLSPATQERIARVARRLADGYEGEIVLHVKKGGGPSGRSGISFIRWVQTDTFRDDVG